MIIWRISDGKPGHDHQSQGLIRAMSKYITVDCRDLYMSRKPAGFFNYLFKKFPAGENLPKPDLIIGAGHGTHLDVLSAQQAFGGKTVILMKPSIPVSVFDFCLIPEHDKPPGASNVIITRGAINLITPSTHHDNKLGLIMIGGPSKHFGWSSAGIIKQIEYIAERYANVFWQVTNSPRTPDTMLDALENLEPDNTTFKSYKETPSGWVEEQLQQCGLCWVTSDSISMIYESLTAGAATGILHVPEKRTGKIKHSLEMLNRARMITLYDEWYSGKKLLPPPVALNEADRCAKELIKKLS